jgi:hypothetical protein
MRPLLQGSTTVERLSVMSSLGAPIATAILLILEAFTMMCLISSMFLWGEFKMR